MLRYIYSRLTSQPRDHLPFLQAKTQMAWLVYFTGSSPNWLMTLTTQVKTPVIIYFSDTHTSILPATHLRNFSHTIHMAFPLSLVYLKTQLHILFLKSTTKTAYLRSICLWCNVYRRRKWTWRHEFKSWTWLNAFHIALIPLGKVWIQLFSLQLWVNSRADWFLQPWWGN